MWRQRFRETSFGISVKQTALYLKRQQAARHAAPLFRILPEPCQTDVFAKDFQPSQRPKIGYNAANNYTLCRA
ncbi:hypothetical protein [Neisseria sp.]|uniref:hypothetical protein n=1 Tax=Neisseria sp. TaxID=192066 RepID=UPI0035A06943